MRVAQPTHHGHHGGEKGAGILTAPSSGVDAVTKELMAFEGDRYEAAVSVARRSHLLEVQHAHQPPVRDSAPKHVSQKHSHEYTTPQTRTYERGSKR